MSERKTSITPRAENFSEWYGDVIAAAQLAENAPVIRLEATTWHTYKGL